MKKVLLSGLFLLATLGQIETASADTFTTCKPNSMNWSFINDERLIAIAKQEEYKRCEVVNATYDSWKNNFQVLGDAETDIRNARNANNFAAVKASFDKASPIINDIHSQAQKDSSILGASNIIALFGSDLNYLFQNAGLIAPVSSDGLTDSISKMLSDPAKQNKAAGVAQQLIYQTRLRAQDFVQGSAERAGLEATKIYQKQSGDIARENATNAIESYRGQNVQHSNSSDFFYRISHIYAPSLTFLFIVAVIGAMTARRVKLDPFTAAVKAVMAAIIPMIVVDLLLLFLPFISQWLVIGIGLVGTFAIYFRSAQILGGLASRCSRFPALAAGLRWMGGFVSGLNPQKDVESGAASVNTAAHHTHGSSRWGTAAEMKENGHLLPKERQEGFTLARELTPPNGVDGKFRFTGHVVTVAPTGSGKGIGAVVPNLLTYLGSALVFDPKGENAEVTGRRRREMGQSVHVIDPFGVTSGKKESVNLLDRLDVNSPDCVSESAVLAESLVMSEKGGENNHFDESARTLLQGLMLHVSSLEDKSRRNLAELRRLITSDEETLLGVLADMADNESLAFGIPARAANTLMGMADRERGSVLSTARKNTAFLDDPRIASALSHSDFNLAAIKAEPMTVYLVLPANRIAANTRFVRLFVGSVISAVTESKAKPKHNVAFILDEFNVLGYMKSIEDAVSLLRGYGLSFWVFLQDLSQLKSAYPKWQTFLANSAKTFYGTDDYDTAKYISDTLGKSTVEYETQNAGRNSGGGVSGGGGSMNRGRSAGTSQQFAGRELLTPDEVMRLGPTKPIVILKGEYPYLLDRINYLTDPEYQGMADPNPYY